MLASVPYDIYFLPMAKNNCGHLVVTRYSRNRYPGIMKRTKLKRSSGHLRGEAKHPGIVAAAALANVSRQHLYLCLIGQRKPSRKVVASLAEHPLGAALHNA